MRAFPRLPSSRCPSMALRRIAHEKRQDKPKATMPKVRHARPNDIMLASLITCKSVQRDGTDWQPVCAWRHRAAQRQVSAAGRGAAAVRTLLSPVRAFRAGAAPQTAMTDLSLAFGLCTTLEHSSPMNLDEYLFVRAVDEDKYFSHACCAEACVEAPSACRTGICCKCFAEYEEAEPRTPDAYQHGCCLHSDDGMECEICCSCWGAHRRKRMAFLAKFALSNANATAAPESIKQTMCAVHHASALSRGSARVIDAAHVERGPTRRVA